MLKTKKLEDKMEAKIDEKFTKLKFIKMIAKDEGYEKSNIQKRQWMKWKLRIMDPKMPQVPI